MRVHVAFTPSEAATAELGIVVDVVRATSSIAQALAAGYRRVLCCAEVDQARALRASLDDAVVGGERDAVRIEGFDLGASPRELLEPRAETLVLSTTNGTRAILAAAERCDEVVLGSLLNLDAVARAARATGDVAILCAGFKGGFAFDDAYCAGRIVAALGGKRTDAANAAGPRGRHRVVRPRERPRRRSPARARGRRRGRSRVAPPPCSGRGRWFVRQSFFSAWCVSPVPTAPKVPALLDTCVACAALATDRRPGEYIASSNAAVVASWPTAKTVVALLPENEVEM
ncbi:MAG: 2-phosphosulfolactate phosphatase [Actinobacteria bacterium]|nr:MAG: 2-phosphosulfolactate phosphatase [Actinomycetota bacterium]